MTLSGVPMILSGVLMTLSGVPMTLLFIYSQVSEEGSYFVNAQVTGMALIIKENVSFSPITISFLSPQTHMPQTSQIRDLIKELAFRHGGRLYALTRYYHPQVGYIS